MQSCKVKARKLRSDAVRIGERILNRKAHIGRAHLRKHCTVTKFDHRMHNGLRVNKDFDSIRFNIKQPPGLHKLKSLVEQRG